MKGQLKLKGKEMKCKIKNREKVINDYFLGALSKADKEAFDEHCFNCDICFHELMLKEEALNLIKEKGRSIFAEYLRKQKHQVKQPIRLNVLNFSFGNIRKMPSYAFAAALVVLLLLGSYHIFQKVGSGTQYAFNFDNQVPYEYTESSLRGDSINSLNFPEYYDFVNKFQKGISYYLSWEYSSVIDTWQNMDTIAKDIAIKTDNKQFLKVARDYYFYKGLSHLALSVSQKVKFNNQIRISHRDAAIYYISKADSLAKVYNLDEINRESSFLEKALSIDGK